MTDLWAFCSQQIFGFVELPRRFGNSPGSRRVFVDLEAHDVPSMERRIDLDRNLEFDDL